MTIFRWNLTNARVPYEHHLQIFDRWLGRRPSGATRTTEPSTRWCSPCASPAMRPMTSPRNLRASISWDFQWATPFIQRFGLTSLVVQGEAAKYNLRLNLANPSRFSITHRRTFVLLMGRKSHKLIQSYIWALWVILKGGQATKRPTKIKKQASDFTYNFVVPQGKPAIFLRAMKEVGRSEWSGPGIFLVFH